MGLGTLVGTTAVGLLVTVAVAVVQALLGNARPAVTLLDRILLILMMVELLYTVQVSFREHTLAPEPFLIVGLIAAIRRLLVLTAEFAGLLLKNEGAFQGAMIELGLLTVMIVALVVSLVILRKHSPHGVAERAWGRAGQSRAGWPSCSCENPQRVCPPERAVTSKRRKRGAASEPISQTH